MLFNYYSLTFTYSKQGEVNLYLCICLVKKARALVKVVGPLVASEEYKVYNTPMLDTLEELCDKDTIAGHPATVVAIDRVMVVFHVGVEEDDRVRERVKQEDETRQDWAPHKVQGLTNTASQGSERNLGWPASSLQRQCDSNLDLEKSGFLIG